MVIGFISSKELLEGLILVINLIKIIKSIKMWDTTWTVHMPGWKANHGLWFYL